jgi:hypothetical protein
MNAMIERTLRFTDKCARPARTAPAILALLVLVGATSVAQAANSWDLNISEKELKLVHPSDPAWDSWFQTDTGFQRMSERNMPVIELINNSGSTDPITQFHLTIGDERFNFGSFSGGGLLKLSKTTPGFSLTSNTLNNDGDELVVDIGNGGLLPGQLVRFKINLDIDSSFAAQYKSLFGDSQPDYRTILFDMNGVNVYDGNTVDVSTADNGQGFVIFNGTTKSNVDVFEDETVAASQFINNKLRSSCCCGSNDPVQIFQLEGQIPEPGSVALALLGLAAGLFTRTRGRRAYSQLD